ncbi:hypothetical protein Glove_48g101 [Diversispora epigaea]|uniref:Sel1 repeat family protein n=1 Tax=Diversispora epigaea TaxID=1348612 RepID=A0A397JQA4_9GLOM|nr:hypothetical protein Glove_48g101 [Diversispora epigaea]
MQSWPMLSTKDKPTKDEENAFQWYLKSAEGGNNDGQNKLFTKMECGDYKIDKIIQMAQLDKNENEREIWRWID